jgi:hypothetical protein
MSSQTVDVVIIVTKSRARFCTVEGAGIVSKESTPPAYVTWRAGTTSSLSRVIVPVRQVRLACGIDSLESIPVLLKCLHIRALL